MNNIEIKKKMFKIIKKKEIKSYDKYLKNNKY